jgi:hypothetical protein
VHDIDAYLHTSIHTYIHTEMDSERAAWEKERRDLIMEKNVYIKEHEDHVHDMDEMKIEISRWKDEVHVLKCKQEEWEREREVYESVKQEREFSRWKDEVHVLKCKQEEWQREREVYERAREELKDEVHALRMQIADWERDKVDMEQWKRDMDRQTQIQTQNVTLLQSEMVKQDDDDHVQEERYAAERHAWEIEREEWGREVASWELACEREQGEKHTLMLEKCALMHERDVLLGEKSMLVLEKDALLQEREDERAMWEQERDRERREWSAERHHIKRAHQEREKQKARLHAQIRYLRAEIMRLFPPNSDQDLGMETPRGFGANSSNMHAYKYSAPSPVCSASVQQQQQKHYQQQYHHHLYNDHHGRVNSDGVTTAVTGAGHESTHHQHNHHHHQAMHNTPPRDTQAHVTSPQRVNYTYPENNASTTPQQQQRALPYSPAKNLHMSNRGHAHSHSVQARSDADIAAHTDAELLEKGCVSLEALTCDRTELMDIFPVGSIHFDLQFSPGNALYTNLAGESINLEGELFDLAGDMGLAMSRGYMSERGLNSGGDEAGSNSGAAVKNVCGLNLSLRNCEKEKSSDGSDAAHVARLQMELQMLLFDKTQVCMYACYMCEQVCMYACYMCECVFMLYVYIYIYIYIYICICIYNICICIYNTYIQCP